MAGTNQRAGDLEIGFTDTLARHPTAHLVTDHSVPIPQWLLNFEDKRPLLPRQLIAEAFGVFSYAYCGGAAFAAFFLSSAVKEVGFGSLLTVGFGYGFGIAFGLLIAAMTSGGHLNPAVTISFWLLGRFPTWKVPLYILAQIFGGFVAALFVYAQYYYQFGQINTLFRATGLATVSNTGPAAVFVAIPAVGQPAGQLFLTEFFTDAFIGLMIFVVLDQNNLFISPTTAPFIVGLVYAVMIWGFGINTLSTNLAKDFGGRCATSIFYGREVWTTSATLRGYAAIAGLVNILSTVLAAFFYQLMFASHRASIAAGHGIHPEMHQTLQQERARRKAEGLPEEGTGAMVRRLTANANGHANGSGPRHDVRHDEKSL